MPAFHRWQVSSADYECGSTVPMARGSCPVTAAVLAGEHIPPEPQEAEIHLGGLAGRGRGDAHRDSRVPEVAVRARKAIERGVGNRDALRAESPVHLRQPEPILRQPRRDGRAVRQERPHLVAQRLREVLVEEVLQRGLADFEVWILSDPEAQDGRQLTDAQLAERRVEIDPHLRGPRGNRRGGEREPEGGD
jgi:hypothetical protein